MGKQGPAGPRGPAGKLILSMCFWKIKLIKYLKLKVWWVQMELQVQMANKENKEKEYFRFWINLNVI
jgi:hypothetical protein